MAETALADRLPLLTTADLARIYRIPTSTIRRWAAEGRLTQHGTPHRRLYNPHELDQLTTRRLTTDRH